MTNCNTTCLTVIQMSTSELTQNKSTKVTLLHGRKLLRARNSHAQVNKYYAWLLQYVHVILFPHISQNLYDTLDYENSNEMISLVCICEKTNPKFLA